MNELGFSPLYLAVYSGLFQYQTLNLLLKLILIIFSDHPFVVDLLLRNGADVNLKIKTGFSPLFLASSKGKRPRSIHRMKILHWFNIFFLIKLCSKGVGAQLKY